jgi:hypothetical protein
MGVEKKQRKEGDDNDDHKGHQTAPNEPIDHVLGFHVARATRTAARALRQHVAAVPTGLCAHCLWPAAYTTLPVHEVHLI